MMMLGNANTSHGTVKVYELRVRKIPVNVQAVANAELFGAAFEKRPLRAVAREIELRVDTAPDEHGHGLEEYVETFVLLQPTAAHDAELRPALRAASA